MFFHDEQKKILWSPANSTTRPEGIMLRYGEDKKGVASHVATSGVARISNNPREDEHWYGDVEPQKFKTLNILTVPVKIVRPDGQSSVRRGFSIHA
jgi:hypothetical protein